MDHMHIKEEPEETLEHYESTETTNQLINYDIVKEEYIIEEASVAVEERDQKEFVNFEISEIEPQPGIEDKIECRICGKTFKAPYQLKKHSAAHSSDRNFHCAHCPRKFKFRTSLIRHLETHFKKPVQCRICNRTIKTSWGLLQHLKRQHYGKTQVSCHHCDKIFATKESLSNHIKRYHERPRVIEVIDKKPLICSVCGKLFKRQFTYDRHLINHQKEDLECKICFRKFPCKRILKDHMGTHDTERPFVCEICNKAFRLERFLRIHSKIHMITSQEPVNCNYCDKSFGKLFGLQSHMKNHHRGLPRNPRPFPSCTICKKKFKNLEDLMKHVGTHSVVMRFECAICGKTAKFKYLIGQHIVKMHLRKPNQRAVKTVECHMCFKKFYNTKNLNAHFAVHNPERPYNCEVCNKTFKTRDVLKIHKKSHVKVNKKLYRKCVYCTKTFKTKNNLINHLRSTHRGLPPNPDGPPFRCTICKLTHKTMVGLKKHVGTHRIFKCAICARKYFTKHFIELHMEKVHLHTKKNFNGVQERNDAQNEAERSLQCHESSPEKSTVEQPKTKYFVKKWKFVGAFQSMADIKTEHLPSRDWSFFYSTKSKAGTKRYYRCKKAKRREKQCSAQKYVLIPRHGSKDFQLFITESEHDHDLLPKKRVEERSALDVNTKPLTPLTTRNQVIKEENLTDQRNESTPGKSEKSITEQPKTKYFVKKWKLIGKFQSMTDILTEHLPSTDWAFFYSASCYAGSKRYFRCKKAKKRGKQCSAQKYVLMPHDSTDFYLYITESEHDHDLLSKSDLSQHGMDPAVKRFIEERFALNTNVKPITVRNQMKLEKNLTVPSEFKIRSYLTKLREENFGKSTISIGEMEEWLQLRSASTSTENDDEAFILKYLISGYDFRFVISTKNLLKNALSADFLQVDSIYKIIWEGFPLIVVGNSDRGRHFHCIALAIFTDEEQEDFEFLFRAIKDGVRDLLGEEYNPSTLVADGTHAVASGFQAVFGMDTTIRVCWAHMRRDLMKNSKGLIENDQLRREIISDVDKIQQVTTTEEFDKSSSLFVKKWANMAKEFIDYFASEWVHKIPNWYERSGLVPRTNKSLESCSREIKDCYTKHEIIPLAQFRDVLKQMIETWSSSYTAKQKQFSLDPEISISLWKNSSKWAEESHSIMIDTTMQEVHYTINSQETETPTKPTELWTSFSDFENNSFSKYVVIFPEPTLNPITDGRCSCYQFAEQLVCKHILGILIREKKVKSPLSDSIEPKRKRGRPPLMRKALIVP